MSKRSLIFAIFLVIILIVIGVGIYYFFREKEEKEHLILYGNVDVRQVDIGFRVAGIIDKLFYEEGDWVAKDDLLATLDRTPYNSQITQAEANVESAKINLKNAEKLLQRRKELVGIGGISEEDLENSETTRDALAANLLAAEAALTIAIDNLSYTDANAPSDGVILTRIREPGTVINPSDPVYTISIASPIWIRAFISEPQLGRICYGMSAQIFTDTKDAPSYRGKVGFISPVAEFTPKTVETTKLRTDLVYRLRIYVDNPHCDLKQGMPVTVKFDLKDQCE